MSNGVPTQGSRREYHASVSEKKVSGQALEMLRLLATIENYSSLKVIEADEKTLLLLPEVSGYRVLITALSPLKQ